jgi:photosystem II stability/assembly factor-like uncharacterized protein
MGDGLFLTLDGGNAWRPVEMEHRYQGEDTFKNHMISSVKIAPSHSNVVWVTHNYWVAKSIDGGQTWVHIKNSTMQRDCTGCGGDGDDFRLCTSLAVDSTDPQTVYVGTRGAENTYLGGAVYRTQDGGATWVKMNQGADFDYSVTDLEIDPQNSQVIWATTSSYGAGGVWGGSLYRSGNGGETWERVFNIDSGVTSVAVKPDDSNGIFTGSGYGVVKHYHDGVQWQFTWPVIPESVGCRMVEDVVFDFQNAEVLYAAWKNPWFGDYLPKVSRSTDGGVTWETYIVDYQFLVLAVDPANSESIYGGDISLGIYRSADHGQTWSPINNGINAVIVYEVEVDPKDTSHILAGTISGVYEKKQGSAWSRLLAYNTLSLEFDPRDSRSFYAGLRGYVAKTTDGGQAWTYSQYPDGSGTVNDICLHPTDSANVFIAVGATGGAGAIYRSEDGGASFSEVLTGVNRSGQPYDFNAVKLDPSNPLHIFAAGGNFYTPRVDGDLWESPDGGVTWDRNPLSILNVTVNDLLIDPKRVSTLYAGCGYSAGTDVPVYKSTDGGMTWEASFDGIPTRRKSLKALWGDSNGEVFALGNEGVILHYDGSAWVEMTSGTAEDLLGIWGSSSASVFAVGEGGTILYYDGKSWTSMASGASEDLWDVWGSSPTHVFAVGAGGTILHYDGNHWTPMTSGTHAVLEGVWGSSSASVFGVGREGTIVHYDGNAWTSMASGTTEELWGIWGDSSTNAFAVGAGGTILHYDGNKWSPMTSGTTMGLNAVWGLSGSDVYAAGEMTTLLHYDGATWVELARLGTREAFQDIWGSSGKNLFFVGDCGSIRRYDGVLWTVMKEPGAEWNAVTDLEFHRKNTDVVYASTQDAGVYISPNQAEKWLGLERPEYSVFALSTGSLYAATQAGLWQCTGTGVIAGQLTDEATKAPINHAMVFNEMGVKTLSVDGEYMMVTPVGVFSVTAVKDGYANRSVGNVTVYGGDVSWTNMDMEAGVSDPTVLGLSGGGDIGGSGCFISSVTSRQRY